MHVVLKVGPGFVEAAIDGGAVIIAFVVAAAAIAVFVASLVVLQRFLGDQAHARVGPRPVLRGPDRRAKVLPG